MDDLLLSDASDGAPFRPCSESERFALACLFLHDGQKMPRRVQRVGTMTARIPNSRAKKSDSESFILLYALRAGQSSGMVMCCFYASGLEVVLTV
jgi:hypothetical protein